jgi:hypothetical protein
MPPRRHPVSPRSISHAAAPPSHAAAASTHPELSKPFRGLTENRSAGRNSPDVQPKRTTKMRARGERAVDRVGTLAARYQVALPRISVGGMNADLLLAQRRPWS